MHKRMSLAATSWYAKNGVDHDFAMQFFLCVTTLSSKIGLSVLGSFFALFAVFVVFVFVTTDYLLGTTITDHYAHWVDYSLFYFLLISESLLALKQASLLKSRFC